MQKFAACENEPQVLMVQGSSGHLSTIPPTDAQQVVVFGSMHSNRERGLKAAVTVHEEKTSCGGGLFRRIVSPIW